MRQFPTRGGYPHAEVTHPEVNTPTEVTYPEVNTPTEVTPRRLPN